MRPIRPWTGRAGGRQERAPAAGFTLVELLVTMAIIGVVSALVMPQLAGARETARRCACSANLRHLATATVCYVEQYRDFPLHESRGVVDEFEVPATTWLCPSDRKRPDFLMGSSYNYLAYNAMFDPRATTPHPPSSRRAFQIYQSDSKQMLYWDVYEWHRQRQAVTYDGVVRQEDYFQNVIPRPAWLDPMESYPAG